MNLRSPAELYIKFLIVHPDKYATSAIHAALTELSIFYLGDEYIERLRRQLIVPDPFRPTDKFHAKSHRFLIANNIVSLFYPTHDTKLAIKILDKPRAREFVESMLLAHAPEIAIAHRVAATGTACTLQAIKEYKKYFWNTELMTSTEFRVLMQMVFDSVAEGDDKPLVQSQKRAMKKASYLDARKLAADLPSSPITALMTQMRMGLMPNRLELAKLLSTARDMATLRVLEATIAGSPQDASKAFNFSIVAKNMGEILETAVRPDDQLREQLQAIVLRTETATIPSIHQLSDGKHTVDILPTMAKEHHGEDESIESEQNGSSDPGFPNGAE